MTAVAVLDMDMGSNRGPAHHPRLRGQVEVIDCYTLPDIDLNRYAGVVVAGGSIDQMWLERHRAQLHDHLDVGGVVVFGGHLYRDWLPGAHPFIPKQVNSHRDYAVRVVTPHPIFDRVEDRDLSLRRGVAGFFARGHHPPPDGAQTLVAFHTGEPVTYLDHDTTRGTILVQSTSDLLGYVNSETTAARLPTQLIHWIREASQTPARPLQSPSLHS